MSGIGRRPLLLVASLLTLGLLSYELLPRDETQIADLLNQLCAELNQTHDQAALAALKPMLEAALLPNASIRVEELGLELEGPEQVLERERELLKSGIPVSFALNSIDVHLSGKLARVDMDVLLTVRGSGEQSRDLRHTHVRLSKSASSWRVEAVDIDAVAPSEPEARP